MSQHVVMKSWSTMAAVGIFTAVLTSSASFVAAEPPASSPTVQEEQATPADAGKIEERGVTKGATGKEKKRPEGLPAKLCQEVTLMRTQCRCANATDCQVLSTLCPGSCPVGSQSCQCYPLFRGTPPPLPQNLCGAVPWKVTQCSCDNLTDCQVLSTICPASCPVGSQSCQCTPLSRG